MEKFRRLVFIIAAGLFFLSTILPNTMAMGMADMNSGTAVSAAMCPGCDPNMMKLGTSCTQVSCIGIAIVDQPASLVGSHNQMFPLLAAIHPDEISWVTPTPPI
jgi:hypothetical protein